MKKLLFLLLSVTILASCGGKDDTPTPTHPEDEYPTLIIGTWKMNNMTEYYTPTGGGEEATRNATEDDGIMIWKFNSDKTLTESDPVDGTIYSKYNYVITGSNLKLTEQTSGDIFTYTLLTLNSSTLKVKNAQFAGEDVANDDGDIIGTLNYLTITFDKQ